MTKETEFQWNLKLVVVILKVLAQKAFIGTWIIYHSLILVIMGDCFVVISICSMGYYNVGRSVSAME
jgi:hypothetical protein